MFRPDSRQGLVLLGSGLALLLVVEYWGLKPLNRAMFCGLILLVSAFILWRLQRSTSDSHSAADASLPPDT